MTIYKLILKELKALKIHFLIIVGINLLIMLYLRGKTSSPGMFLVALSIPFTIIYVAIFIQGFHVVKKEFDNWTIYLLLQLPISLEEILFSKFVSVFIEGFSAAFVTSIIASFFLMSFHQISSIPVSIVLKLAILSGLVVFPVITIFYPAFSVRMVTRKFSTILAFVTAAVSLYIDHLIYTILSPLESINFNIATYSLENVININVSLNLQTLLFYLIAGVISLFAGIWVIKKFNSL